MKKPSKSLMSAPVGLISSERENAVSVRVRPRDPLRGSRSRPKSRSRVRNQRDLGVVGMSERPPDLYFRNWMTGKKPIVLRHDQSKPRLMSYTCAPRPYYSLVGCISYFDVDQSLVHDDCTLNCVKRWDDCRLTSMDLWTQGGRETRATRE